MKNVIIIGIYFFTLHSVFSQKVEYFERNTLSLGLIYSPNISSHQWHSGA